MRREKDASSEEKSVPSPALPPSEKGKVQSLEMEECVPWAGETPGWHIQKIKEKIYQKISEEATCKEIRSRYLDIVRSHMGGDTQFVEQTIAVTQGLHVIKEEMLNKRAANEGRDFCARFRVAFLPLPCDSLDPDFHVVAKLSRDHIWEGDKDLRIEVSATRDAYFYVFSVEGDETGILLPNPYLSEDAHFRRAGEPLEIPPEGFHLNTTLQEGKTESYEHLKIIALKEDFPLYGKLSLRTKRLPALSPGDILKNLTRADPSRWTSAAVDYVVHKRP